MEKQKIDSLQGLRFFLFLTVFFFHASKLIKDSLIWRHFFAGGGVLAVGYFFILSGFVVAFNENPPKNIKEWERGIKRRFAKFAMVHWPLLLVELPLRIINILTEPLKTIWIFFLNLFLLQSWSLNEKVVLSFNGVAWFLSTSMFLYAITPILNWIYNVNRLNKKKFCFFIILCCSLGAVILSLLVNSNPECWLYTFPTTRILDYSVGFFCGKLFLINRREQKKNVTYLEVILFLTYIFLLIINPNLPENIRRFCIYLIPGAFTIYIIAYNNGVISRILSKKVFVIAGGKSLYYMMAHQIIIYYLEIAYRRLPCSGEAIQMLLVICALVVTMASEPIFNKVVHFFIVKFHTSIGVKHK